MSGTAAYHEGEISVQSRAGERDAGIRNGSIIADTIVKGALRFVAEQPFVAAGSTDDAGRLWASVLLGEPGFMSATGRRVEIDLTRMLANAGDPFWANIERHPDVGTLFLEFRRRRRLRVNGRASRVDGDRLRIDVAESYPNCPKYIRGGALSVTIGDAAAGLDSRSRGGDTLTPEQLVWIAGADTMFVASAHADRGVDVSHRGGKAGFVQALDERTLRIPDYAGNSMFNTLGNIAANPRAGLLFTDFGTGRTLQLTGKAEILWDQDLPEHETGGTRRYWTFECEWYVETVRGAGAVWAPGEPSPFNP